MSENSKFYITTAIDYPNNRPHIGTAFEKIGADVQARFQRMEGESVHFLMGNDEHAAKVDQRAEEMGQDTQSYVNGMAVQFKEVWKNLDVSNDDFIQTSEQRHKLGCQQFLQRVYDAGDIYKSSYEGMYCEGCEDFKTERDLVDGKCPDHSTRPIKHLQEENYFFALSKFQDRLLSFYADNPRFIQPETRRNEILNLVKSGLQDVSITRRGLKWGIDVPFDSQQKIYVWFDALLNYITAIGYGSDEDRFRKWWPAEVHVIGKDITRFHCALWPAMLMSAGIPLPRRVFAHGFVYQKGEKISKTLGNIVDPIDLSERFGSDAFRYYFMRECPFGDDGDFTYDRFTALFNSDLANNLGNLYSRTVNMCQRYFDGELTETAGLAQSLERSEIYASVNMVEVIEQIIQHMESCEYHLVLTKIWQQILDPANRYIEQQKPFELAKSDLSSCKRVLVNLVSVLGVAAILIKPFMPRSGNRVYHTFNYPVSYDSVSFSKILSPPPFIEDLKIQTVLTDGKVEPLFPRIRT